MAAVVKIRNAVPDSGISWPLHQFRILRHVLYQGYADVAFHYPRISLPVRFVHIHLYCIMSVACVSIREMSRKMGVAYTTAYRMSRRIMYRLADFQVGMALEGSCEVDELHAHAGMKGRRYHDKILESRSLPSRRGLKHRRGRGGFGKDFPTAMCYHQRGGSAICDVPQPFSSIAALVQEIVSKGSGICTDELGAYDSLDSRRYRYESVCHKAKEYARGDVHVNNCECRAGLLRYWQSTGARTSSIWNPTPRRTGSCTTAGIRAIFPSSAACCPQSVPEHDSIGERSAIPPFEPVPVACNPSVPGYRYLRDANFGRSVGRKAKLESRTKVEPDGAYTTGR